MAAPSPVTPVQIPQTREKARTDSGHEKNLSCHYSLLLRQFPDAATETLWREFLAKVECPAHYESPEFFREPYWKNQNPFALLLLQGKGIVATLTGFDQGREITSGLPSRPQVCISKDVDPRLTSQALAEALLLNFPDAKLMTVYAWGTAPLPGLTDLGFREVDLLGNVVLDLRPGAKSVFEHFAPNRRRNIRNAIRNGIEVTDAKSDADLEAYWKVYLAWKHTKRKQIHAGLDFATLAAIHKMRENQRCFLAHYNGDVIAASRMRFYPGGLVEYAGNCSRDEFLNLRPNDLLIWKMIEWACEGGFPAMSMGAAGDFHRKWADTVVPVYRYRLDRTLFHRVELKEVASAKVRQWAHSLPAPVQIALKKLLRSPA